MPDQIVEVISKLGLDATPVFTELDRVNQKYKESNKELEQTNKLLETLVNTEAKLIKARAQANNPTVVAQYNKKIDETRKSIELTEKAQKTLTAETKKYQKELDTTAEKAKRAFDATQTNGVGRSLLAVAGGFGLATGIGAIASGIKGLVEDSVELSAKAEGISTAFSRIGGEATLEKLRKATRGATSDLELMQAALRAKNFNISTDLLAKGLELAGKVARTTGQDVTYLTDSFVDGLGRKSIRILDNLQISQVALQKEIKKTGDFNTAVGNIIDQKLRETGVVIDTTADKLAHFSAGWANLKAAIGDFLINTGSGIIDFFKALGTSATLADVQLKKSLELANKGIQDFNGGVLDEARESELKRVTLLSESSERLVKLQHELGQKATQADLDNIGKKIVASTGFDRIDAINESKRIERILKRTKLDFDLIQLKIQKETDLNNLLRKLNAKTETEVDEGTAKRLKKERQFLMDLEIDIRRAQSVNRAGKGDNALLSELDEISKLEVKFAELSIQKNIEFEKRRNSINEEIKDEKVKAKVLVQLKTLENIELNTLDEQRIADIRNFKIRQTSLEIEGAKSVAELDLKIAQAQTTFTLDSSDERIAILVDYTRRKVELMELEGKDEIEILKFVKDQALAVEQIRRDDLLKLQKQSNAEFEEAERFHLAMLEYKRRIHQSQITTSEIKFEEQQLATLKKAYEEQVAITGKQDNERLLEIEKQENNIALLKKKQRAQEKQEIIDQTIFVIDNINLIVQATISAANQIIDAEIKKTDTLISNQQRRVDEAAKIAENGNAQLLELEKKRLDDLTKEKEKFVRAQQTLASLELIANTAVAVSKAAAEGGAGAAFTIAAALIALIAGLASARSIAGQAAFFKGGESDGFTGEGNIHDPSTKLGAKPYIYHKKEFIFNNETTSKYLNIFRKVHAGEVDLNKMKFESDMYRTLRERNVDTGRDIHYRSIESGSSMELSKLKSSFDSVIDAIKAQPGMSVNIDENGIAIITNRFYKNKQRIDAIT